MSPLSAATTTPAQRDAAWLVTQAPNGVFGTPPAIAVAQTTSFAFAVATNPTARGTALKGMRTLWVNASSLANSVSDDPGALAQWIMAAHAYGVNPRHFSTVDLVAKFLTSGFKPERLTQHVRVGRGAPRDPPPQVVHGKPNDATIR
jgi:hypothetical protein